MFGIFLIPQYFYREYISANSVHILAERGYWAHGYKSNSLILGNSHLMPLFQDQSTPGVYNYSIPSLNYIQTYYLLNHLIKKPHEFDTILLPLGFESFARTVDGTGAYSFFWGKYLNYFELSFDAKGDFKPMIADFIQGRFFSYVGRYDQIFHFLKGQDIYKLEHQKQLDTSLFFGEFDSSKREMMLENRYGKLLRNQSLVMPEAVSYFYKLMDLCKKNNIRIIFIRMPITRVLFDKINQHSQIGEYNTLLKVIFTKYPEAKFIDYQYLAEGHDNWFRDPDHLNPHGAKQLTRILSKNINF